LAYKTSQTDVRKRVSELIASGVRIEKERKGIYVNFKYDGGMR
jgi:hypothetical protein